MENDESTLHNYPLLKTLISSFKPDTEELDEETFTQSIISVLVQAGKVASASGYSTPTSAPLGKADSTQMLSSLERLLEICTKIGTQALLIHKQRE